VVHIFRKHCVELEHQVIHGEVRKFIPLNLEIEVWRGLAPGAGFEAQQSEVSGSLVTQLNLNQSDTDAASNSLSLIAAGIQEAQALFEMNQSRSGSLSPKETISILASRLRRLIPFDCCAFYLTQSDTVILQHVDGDHASCFSAQPVTLGDGISGWVAQSGKLILNGNAAVEPSYHKQTGEREMLKAALSMPMFDLQKNVFGVLTLYSCRADSFSREHARVLQVMESKLSHTIQKAMHLGRSESSMEIDALTGLPSANGLFVRLEKELNRSRRNSGALAVIVCDVNSFKNINERDGYLTGNEVLASLGDRFRQGCRPYDTIARMGGDEFVFLIADMVEADFVERLRSLVEIVSTPDASLKLTSELSASFGASFYPGDGDTAEDLLAAADRRMHLNKQAYYSAEASRTQYIQHSEDGTS
jgi:diguanylate cyclase (GGDEF)-like protein